MPHKISPPFEALFKWIFLLRRTVSHTWRKYQQEIKRINRSYLFGPKLVDGCYSDDGIKSTGNFYSGGRAMWKSIARRDMQIEARTAKNGAGDFSREASTPWSVIADSVLRPLYDYLSALPPRCRFVVQVAKQ